MPVLRGATEAVVRWANRIDRARLRTALPAILIVVGAAVLLFVGAQYYSMYSAQRRLAQEWERQNAAAAAAPATAAPVAHDGLTKVSIPKIELEAIVVEGTSSRQLLKGPGRLTNSAQVGEKGNAVITAHRDTFFRRVFDLGAGDEIVVQRNGETYKYQVTGKKVVPPSDVSVLRDTEDAQLTLITCYPPNYIGPAPERLVVFSKLVERTQNTASGAVPPAGGSN